MTGISQGIARFTFISDLGCSSNLSAPISIFGLPNVINPGPDNLCLGSTLSLLPSVGGSWASSDSLIATITNTGLITGVSAGIVTFEFTDSVTNCTSAPSEIITVNNIPSISILGPDSICIGNTTQLSPTVGGLWYSNNPSIATINNSGLVTGFVSGQVTFYFVKTSTGCTSAASLPIEILTKPIPQFVSVDTACVGIQCIFYQLLEGHGLAIIRVLQV